MKDPSGKESKNVQKKREGKGGCGTQMSAKGEEGMGRFWRL